MNILQSAIIVWVLALAALLFMVMAHAPKSFWPAINQGEGAILFCFIFLYLAFAGGGTWSVDTAMRRSQ
mgnify:CR=1 FL=1